MLTNQQILKILDWDKSPTIEDGRGLFARIIKVAREAERQEREALAKKWEEKNGFDAHRMARFIRSGGE